jgi:uncharacterized membrane protein
MTLLLVLILLVLVCIALTRAAELGRQLSNLQLRHDHLETRVDHLTSFVETPAGPVRPQAPAPATQPAYHPAPPAPAPAPAARTSREWEALIGEKLLNRVGALTIILAAGFFLRYAFAHNWIPPVVRVLLGVAAGGGLVGLAGRYRTKLPIFAQGILGSGLSILYLSAYASFGFYRLIPLPVAFAAMAAVTALVLQRALTFDSLAVGLLGWTGGFLTPLVLSGGGAGGGSGARLFVYLFLLTAALVAMAWRRPAWAVLEPLTLAGAYGSYGIWRVLSAPAGVDGTAIGVPLAFLTGIWAVFFALDVLRSARQTPAPADRYVWSSANGALYFVAAYELLTPAFAGWAPVLAAVMALAYMAPVVVLRRQMPAFALKAITLLAAATALQFDGYPRAVAWSLEAAALVAAGAQLKAAHVRHAALGLMGIGLGAAVLMPSTFVQSLPYTPTASGRSWALALQAAALAAAAWSYRRMLLQAGDPVPGSRMVEQALHFGWTTVLLLLVSVEVSDYLRLVATPRELGYTTALALIPVWAAFGAGAGWLGSRRKLDGVMAGGLMALGLSVAASVAAGFRFVPVDTFTPVANLRFLALAAAIAGCLVYRRFVPSATPPHLAVRRGIDVAAGVLVFVLLTGEISDFYRHRLHETGFGNGEGLASIRNQRQLALSMGWLVYSAVAIAMGFWRRHRSLRLAAIAMLGVTVLKVFAVDLSFLEQGYRILSFLGLGVLLLAASFLYQRHRDIILGNDDGSTAPSGNSAATAS